MFVTRLLQSGLILNEKLESKYKHDIHCNDIELLAYYTALANIETTYHEIKHKRVPFNNILFTDTFSQNPLYFKDGVNWKKQQKIGETFGGSHKLLGQQKNTQLNVIIGNPPYSGGQETASEDNPNMHHVELETRIKNTYIELAPKGNIKGLYNSYIKALRWASDRIGKSGIIGFIIPSAWTSGHSEAGIRAHMKKDKFTDVWCFDLLGQKGQKGHGRNIFEYKGTGDGGSTQGISIAILVKNPAKQNCTIHYTKLQEIYYSGSDKRNRVKELKSIFGIKDWKSIIPNKYHDWLDQRGCEDEEFNTYMRIGNNNNKQNKTNKPLFDIYSGGLITSRDAWVYNASKNDLKNNIKHMIDHCNMQDPDNFDKDPKKIAWTKPLSKKIKKIGKPIQFSNYFIRVASYRPFIKQYLYFDPTFVTDTSLVQSLFPLNNIENPTIIVPDKNQGDFSTFLINNTPDVNTVSPSRCFPIRVKPDLSKMSDGGGGVEMANRTPPSYHNPTIIVSNKNKGEFSAFMTNATPDFQTVSNGKCFPMRAVK